MDLLTIDYRTFFLFNSLMGSSKVFDAIVYVLAEYLILLFPLSFLVLVWYWRNKSKKTLVLKMVFAALVAAFCVWVVDQLLGFVWMRQRPFVHFETVTFYTVNYITSKSFPSDHTAVSFALATSIFLWGFRRMGILALIAALVIGLARITLGLHFPSDVLVGCVLGVASAFLWRYLLTRKKSEKIIKWFGKEVRLVWKF